MRRFLLILFPAFCTFANAQILPGQARLENFNPYKPVSGTLEFLPDSIHPETVREYAPEGNIIRHASVKVVNGKWYIDGPDTIWTLSSQAIFQVKHNLPEGPFSIAYTLYHGERSEYREYRGHYLNGLLHGKMTAVDGSYFTFKGGLLHGPYSYIGNYGSEEKGSFVNGYRDGKVTFYQRKVKAWRYNGDFNGDNVSYSGKRRFSTFYYQNGYLLSGQYHYEGEMVEGGYSFQGRVYVHSDTISNILQIVSCNQQGDTTQIQTHFQPHDMRQSWIYNPYQLFDGDYYYAIPELPERLRIEVNESSFEMPTNEFTKRVRWFYKDRGYLDSTYHYNSSALHSVYASDGSFYEYDENGRLMNVRTQYQLHHNPVTCLYGLKDRQGEWVLEAEYEAIHYCMNTGFMVKKLGRYGLCDWEGKVLIEPALEEMENLEGYNSTIGAGTVHAIFQPDLARYFRARIRGKWGVLDAKGKWLIEPDYLEIQYHSPFYFLKKAEKEYRIWKQAGDSFILFPWVLDEIGYTLPPFQVRHQQKWGVLSPELEWIIPPEYDRIYSNFHIYAMGTSVSPVEMTYTLFTEKGERLGNEVLSDRPNMMGGYIETTRTSRYKHYKGVMNYEGRVLAKEEYDQVEDFWFTTNQEDCFLPFYVLQRDDKRFILDSAGRISQAYWPLTPVIPYSEKPEYWGNWFPNCPKIISFIVKEQGRYRIIDNRERTLLDSSSIGERIDSIWTYGVTIYVNTPTRLLLYFSDTVLFTRSGARTSEVIKYSRLKNEGSECIVTVQDRSYGLIDSYDGTWLLRPEYVSIEKRGYEYVLKDRKGKISIYRRGEDNTRKRTYSLCYPIDNLSYVAYSHSGKAGVINTNNQLVVDTAYHRMAYQLSYGYVWYWGEKSNGRWDVFQQDGKMVYANVDAASGNVLNNGSLIVTRRNGKKALLDEAQTPLLEGDEILIPQYGNELEYLYRNGKNWGRYRPSGNYTHEAVYTKIWPWHPFLVMHNGQPGVLDSSGKLMAPMDSVVFLKTDLPWRDHPYVAFCRNNYLNLGYVANCRADSLSQWHSNLLFLLHSRNRDMAHYSGNRSGSLCYVRVLPNGETEPLPVTIYFLDPMYQLKEHDKYVSVSLTTGELFSTFTTILLSENDMRYAVETYSYHFDGSQLKRLYMGDIVNDEKTLESLMIEALAKENLPVESCPDLKMLYALNKDRFFLDETGISFLIEVSYEREYLQIQIPYTSLKEIMRPTSPVYRLAPN